MNMHRKQGGFTLIELMSAVGIVSILASVALPAYRDYSVRAKVTEGIVQMSAAKSSVAEYYQTRGILPPGGDNMAAGITQLVNTPYVESVDWHNDQRIEIEFNEVALGISGQLELQLDPEISPEGVMTWRCGHDNNTTATNLKYTPFDCRTRYW